MTTEKHRPKRLATVISLTCVLGALAVSFAAAPATAVCNVYANIDPDSGSFGAGGSTSCIRPPSGLPQNPTDPDPFDPCPRTPCP